MQIPKQPQFLQKSPKNGQIPKQPKKLSKNTKSLKNP